MMAARINPPATALPTAMAVIRLLLLELEPVSNVGVVVSVVVVVEIVFVGRIEVTIAAVLLFVEEETLSGTVYLCDTAPISLIQTEKDVRHTRMRQRR
jgi:hypothetical protein